MLRYTVKRLFTSILVLVGVVSIVFFLFNIMPGDPARLMLGQRADEASLESIKQDLGLNKPMYIQYFNYLNDLSPISFHSLNPNKTFYLDSNKYDFKPLISTKKSIIVAKIPYLRRSYQNKKKVTYLLSNYMTETAVLAISAITIATLLGIIFGMIAAIYKNTFFDKSLIIISTTGMSIPSFYAAILISWIFGYLLSEYTGLTMTGSLFEYDDLGNGKTLRLTNLILPAITLGIRPVCSIMLLTRNSMLDVVSQDYIRTAKAKGLTNFLITIKHALKNAINPVFTAISGMFASLLAGALFVENIFAWKGLGWILYESLTKFDLPVVMGGVILTSTFFVIINILVDIGYKILDPRIRLN